MTETIFPEMMKRPETGFDAMDADTSPRWWCGAAASSPAK